VTGARESFAPGLLRQTALEARGIPSTWQRATARRLPDGGLSCEILHILEEVVIDADVLDLSGRRTHSKAVFF